jgi:hypothetical protein
MRVFHGCLRRALAGAVGAGLLVLAIPIPSMAVPTPSVTITDVTVTEGTGGTVSANFTIQAAPTPKPGAALQVSWATASVSATAPADFTSSSGTVSLMKNSASRVVSVPVVGDALNEANETFMVNLFNLAGSPGSIGDAQGVATIIDNDPIPVLSVNDVSIMEGNAGTTAGTFTVTLSAASGRPVTFDWATSAGSATAGTDYVAASGSRTIAAGAPNATVGITVNGDVVDEPSETFGITLTNPGNATIGDGSGVATIADDDAAPALSVDDVTVVEGNAGTTTATFTVSLSSVSSNPVTFDWATAAGSATAGTDYVAAGGTRTIAAGATIATIDVTVNGDVVDEANETYGITLSNPGNATIADGSGLGTITDDDAAPTLSVNDVSIVEGNAGSSTATFTVSLSVASGQAVTFGWATAAGSATAGSDYVAAGGTRTIAAGATSATIGITVNGDVLDELDETYGVSLSNPGNATIADGSGLGTITDDDAAPTLSVNDVSVTEGNAGATTATFTVTLSGASGKAVTVDWATADGTAIQPSDYTVGSGTLTFVPGDTTRSIIVTVNGDVDAELGETFRVLLSAASNATLGDAVGVGTIVDDELLAVVGIDEPTAFEDTGTITFTVTLSHPSVSSVTVDWSTAAGTATNGPDYFDTNGIVTFAPGDTTQTVAITVNADGAYELDETMAVDLSNAFGAPIGDAQGIGTIANDDDAPDLSVGDVSVAEGNTGQKMLMFTVSLAGDTDIDTTVDFATTGITAGAGTDYLDATGTLTIQAGATAGTVSVVVNGDVAYEPNETLTFTLTDPMGATIGDGVAQGTITNDDKAPTSLTLGVIRKPHAVVGKGLLEPGTSGDHVTVTLFRKQGGRFVKIAAKTVPVRYLKDRDGDGKIDGSYTATFTRPKAKGTYKTLVRFKGTATHKARSLAKVFTLSAS